MQLLRLMLAICTLSHDKAYVESSYLINKYLLAIHGGSTGEKIIVEFLCVNGHVIQNGSKNNVPNNKRIA